MTFGGTGFAHAAKGHIAILTKICFTYLIFLDNILLRTKQTS